MKSYQFVLDNIAMQRDAMIALTERWANINSGSYHLAGLEHMHAALLAAFAPLGGAAESIELQDQIVVDDNGKIKACPLGKALRIRKHQNAPFKLYLGGHMDTVYGKDHPFQTCTWLDDKRLGGPGVADLKGGLVVMLHALMALEKSEYAGKIGWEVLINPDEEIGSPGSAPLFIESAKRCNVGLVFEPALEDGGLAGARGGSGNFTVVMRGRAAHAGRDFAKGRNAIVALSEYVAKLNALNGTREGVTINPGVIKGGSTVNTVPDLAILKFNVRTRKMEDQAWMENALQDIAKTFAGRDGLLHEVHGGFTRLPKPIEKHLPLFQAIQACGAELGQTINWHDTGGVCDGNNLAAAGLMNVDSLGVRGGNIHSDKEFMLVDSLVERAQLATLFLIKYADGAIRL